MKGPRSRHKFYIVRTWECSACGKRAFVPVQVVNRACYCKDPHQPTWMCLIDEKPPTSRTPRPAEGG